MSNGDESLSPDELAALSEAFSGGDRAERSSADVRGDQETVVLRYDLIGSSSSQRHDFPALDLIHEGFSAALATAMVLWWIWNSALNSSSHSATFCIHAGCKPFPTPHTSAPRSWLARLLAGRATILT